MDVGGGAGKNTADICNAFAEWVPSFRLHCLASDAAAGCVALVLRARASFSFHKADDDDDDDDDRPSLRFSMRTNSMAEGGRGRPESI